MCQGIVAWASVLILVSSCLAARDTLGAVYDRSWETSIVTERFKTEIDCFGVLIKPRAVLVHVYCSKKLKAGRAHAVNQGKENRISMIIRPKNHSYNLALLILSEEVHSKRRSNVIVDPNKSTQFEKSGCSVIFGGVERINTNNRARIETDLVWAQKYLRPRSSSQKIDDSACKNGDFLICPKSASDNTRYVLVGIAGIHAASHQISPDHVCLAPFAKISHDRKWLDSALSELNNLLQSLDNYHQHGSFEVPHYTLDIFTVEPSWSSAWTSVKRFFGYE